jgi:hypothetical protein
LADCPEEIFWIGSLVHRAVVEQLLTTIETSFKDNMIVEAALGAATKASLEILVSQDHSTQFA